MDNWWSSIPFEGNDISEAIDQAIDYISKRCAIEKHFDEYDEDEIEFVREIAHELVPDKLSPKQLWLLLNSLGAVGARFGRKQGYSTDEIQDRVSDALDKAFDGMDVDFKVVNISDSDDPLAKLLRQMPSDPSQN